jgi:hypothetical protein
MPSLPNFSATLAKPGVAGEVLEDEDEDEDEDEKGDLVEEGITSPTFLSTADLTISPMATVKPTITSATITQSMVKRLAGRTKVCGSKTCW